MGASWRQYRCSWVLAAIMPQSSQAKLQGDAEKRNQSKGAKDLGF